MRWGDMDAMGHLNNANYFRYMEQARIGFYERFGLTERGHGLPPECGPVVINSYCTFRRALVYPGTIEVKVFVDAPGRSSIMTWYELRPSYDPAEIYADGYAKACWIDMRAQKSIPLPAPLRALFDNDDRGTR